MVDLVRANARLREAFRIYALLAASGADRHTMLRAAREVDRLSQNLCVLAEVADLT